MKSYSQDHVVESYRRSFAEHGDSAEALQYSPEGQRWRFDKILEIIPPESVTGPMHRQVLEVGCGLGHLCPLLHRIAPSAHYTGIDIVPEMIAHAQRVHPAGRFECRDIFARPIKNDFDYVMISGVFNAPVRENNREFLIDLISHSFDACRIGLAFNFTSTHVNFTSPEMNYFDPAWVLTETITRLSKKIVMHHHHRNCDVAMFVYR